jgi:MFS family permease
VLHGLIPHLVPMLQGRGLDAATAAGVASIFGLASFGGRVLIGSLVDHFDARRIAMIFIFLSGAGVSLLAADLPLWAFYAAAFLLGGTLGAETDLLAFLVSRYFGLRCFAQLFGVMFGVVMIGMAMGPLAFGAVFDATGSYHAILALGAPICFLAIILILFLRAYPRPGTPRPIRR